MNTSLAFSIAGILGLIVLSIAALSGKIARNWRYGLLAGADLLMLVAILTDRRWSLAEDYHDIIGIAFINVLIIRSISKKAA